MSEVVGIGSVVLGSQQDPKLPIKSFGDHKLVAIPKRKETPQQQVAGQFVEYLANIENFVILAQAKDGKLIFFPCVDADPGVALFIDICKAKLVEDAGKKLTSAIGPTSA